MSKRRQDILGIRIEALHVGSVREKILRQIETFRTDVGSPPLVVQRTIGPAEVLMRAQPIYRDGRYDGVLSPSTGVRLSSLLGYAMGIVPIDSYAIEFGEPGAPGAIVDALAEELTRAIDQLTRPVDAIKHQAKTVTVGISRADEALLAAPLVRAVENGALRPEAMEPALVLLLAVTVRPVDEILGRFRPTSDDPRSVELNHIP